MKKEKVEHTLEPVIEKDSEILILGSLPSVKSREEMFYYAHPKNRFWKVMANVFSESEPQTIEEKKQFLKKNKIALYDVIQSCSINGSSDSSIQDVKVNDIHKLVEKAKIAKIYTTGRLAYQLYNRYLKETVKIDAIYLPSTSPANAQISFEELVKYYKNEIIESKKL